MGDFDDYYLEFVDGSMGYGKTIKVVAHAVENSKRYNKIYANFKLILDDEEQDKIVFVPKVTGPIMNGFEEKSLFLAHEGYKYFDCRYCMGKEREKILNSVFEMRKNGIEIVADIIRLLYLDFRIIDIATNFTSALGKQYKQYYERQHHIYYQKKIPIPSGRNEYIFIEQGNRYGYDMSKYYNHYNTREKTGKSQKLL